MGNLPAARCLRLSVAYHLTTWTQSINSVMEFHQLFRVLSSCQDDSVAIATEMPTGFTRWLS